MGGGGSINYTMIHESSKWLANHLGRTEKLWDAQKEYLCVPKDIYGSVFGIAKWQGSNKPVFVSFDFLLVNYLIFSTWYLTCILHFFCPTG